MNTYRQYIAALRALYIHWPGDWICQWRAAIKSGAISGDRLVFRGLEKPRAGVPSLYLKFLTRLHIKQRLIAPIKSKFPGLIAVNLLHVIYLNQVALGAYDTSRKDGYGDL